MPSSPPNNFFSFEGSNGLDMADYWKGDIPLEDQREDMKLSPVKHLGPVLRRSPRKRV